MAPFFNMSELVNKYYAVLFLLELSKDPTEKNMLQAELESIETLIEAGHYANAHT